MSSLRGDPLGGVPATRSKAARLMKNLSATSFSPGTLLSVVCANCTMPLPPRRWCTDPRVSYLQGHPHSEAIHFHKTQRGRFLCMRLKHGCRPGCDSKRLTVITSHVLAYMSVQVQLCQAGSDNRV